jgi:hypothetical protein
MVLRLWCRIPLQQWFGELVDHDGTAAQAGHAVRCGGFVA